MNNSPTFNDLTIIIPTLNEEGNILPLIQELNIVLPGSFIIVVDDSSSDNTPKIVKKLAQNSSKILLIERKGEPCLTLSIMTGICRAKTDYVAWMDADLSAPPKILKKIYKIAHSSGCCIATRFAKNNINTNGSKNRSRYIEKNDTLLSSILSSLLNFFIHHILKLKTTDNTSGFIVCRRDLISSHSLVGDYGEYFIELMYFFDRTGVNVKELFYEKPPRKSGKSKTSPNIIKLLCRGVKYLWMVIRLMLPKAIFGKISLSMKYQRENF
ncbi:putative glycosyltransferase CsbB [subsurface metagenome]